MDATLGYLRESLANYYEKHEVCRRIYEKLETNNYEGELQFVRDLDEVEIGYLNSILPKEINYATKEQDPIRTSQLVEVYELLF
ncbi:sigma-G-dependent sporulation-specific acid-soluble spore protein CsgA [Bacillus alkalicellulosilyticus]|uniref:sigma-G-dependent sporulation-specific acid-soluble spore protein CsgA n=1 Tax=Alkalihalobacterium alkalicellulosilyticum TaxID=1912214 RepID=UPI00099794A7|nr:sigma-G-dependent sporulation-specific acid-soluble spore protein CsgA [Bacillus alkalicellulosilyticus]